MTKRQIELTVNTEQKHHAEGDDLKSQLNSVKLTNRVEINMLVKATETMAKVTKQNFTLLLVSPLQPLFVQTDFELNLDRAVSVLLVKKSDKIKYLGMPHD